MTICFQAHAVCARPHLTIRQALQLLNHLIELSHRPLVGPIHVEILRIRRRSRSSEPAGDRRPRNFRCRPADRTLQRSGRSTGMPNIPLLLQNFPAVPAVPAVLLSCCPCCPAVPVGLADPVALAVPVALAGTLLLTRAVPLIAIASRSISSKLGAANQHYPPAAGAIEASSLRCRICRRSVRRLQSPKIIEASLNCPLVCACRFETVVAKGLLAFAYAISTRSRARDSASL